MKTMEVSRATRPAAPILLASWFAFAVFSALSFHPTTALARTGTPPPSFSPAVPALSAGDLVVLPPVDEQQYLREDAEAAASGIDKPLRFAAPIAVDLSPATAGVWTPLAHGDRIWRCEIVSTGARSLNFGLTMFHLPAGAELYLYPADRSMYDGPYTSGDATPTGEFWTAVVPGDDAVVELYVPAAPAFQPELVITQVAHDYRGFEQFLEKPQEGSCNNDVICPIADPWRLEIRSGGVYTLNGQWTCSGQLFNSNVSNPPPYFETAYHCGISSSNAGTIVVYWKYEAPVCGEHCCGPLTFHQSGSTFKAKWSTSDFCLVQLSQTPETDFNVYYAGWDATTTNAPQSEVVIHHPNCDVKAISFDYRPVTITSWGGDSSPGDGSHWRVDHYDSGTTEPGSSGSALYDQNHHVIGQLHGGYASCTSITQDWYGRVPVSWDGGGTSTTRLKDWLDPNGTGVQVNSGYDPFGPSAVQPPASRQTGGMAQIAPNPTRGSFQVGFELTRPAVTGVVLYDAAGRAVSTVPARAYPAGASRILVAARSDDGKPLAPGIYFVRLTVDGRVSGARKLIVVE